MKLQALGRYRLNGEILGKGNFARVELATHSVLNAKVAIKIIDVDKVKEDYVRRNLGREVKVLSRLLHPNIVRLYETIMSGHLYCLVMEYAPGGDLSSLVKAQREGRFPEGRARPFCRQLVSALTYMHGRGIIHRDLKMENIMLNASKDTLKIVDFGLSNCWSPESPLKSHCGSPEYAAPELFVVGRTYGPEIDVWSLGVVFYVLLVGRLPFLSSKQEGLSRQERRDRLIAHINQGLGGAHRSDMKHLGSECRRLLAKVLEPLPARRLTLRHVAVHPWVTHKGLSPLTGYQHPRVGNREHTAAIHQMSDILSIKPQLIEERVLKQMYDDIAGMYNILTNRIDMPQTVPLPEEARIRPLELRTPSKRPLTSSVESSSPLRTDKTVRPAVTPSTKPASAARRALRPRDERKTVWTDAPWDTPRRHNLTDDQKVRTDDRTGAQRADKSLQLVSGAEDEFSSLYDDFTDDSSAPAPLGAAAGKVHAALAA
ncbi:serine/threonine-protein kinase NIM1-like [Pollicipes pollicipes]|uniref:serine/threonine-protein kinase NIM1-like n=1 Tax=Pollicipes pollicipes TaxID=41117 RepID=UPI001885A307|nr:serine/threonine-protein kinase NIM1-like [Pollicipes pollicipes]